MFDATEFKNCCKSKKLRLQTVAETIGIDKTTLYRKSKRETDFTLGEIEKCYKIFSPEEIQKIFLIRKLRKSDTIVAKDEKDGW